MIIRRIEELAGTERCVSEENWTSTRLLLAKDGMGFSMHETILHAGTETPMWYRNHVEAVYCVEGEGEIVERDTGKVHAIRPGTLYALDQHDRHILRAKTRFRMVCVFNPPVHGPETHDADGSYPLLDAAPETPS